MSTATLPRVRRVPVPDSAPPYEDRRPDLPPAQGALALRYLLPSGLPAVPVVAASTPSQQLTLLGDVEPLRPSAGRAARATARLDAARADERWASRQRSAGRGLPDPRTWSLRLVQGVLESLSGDRPVQQLARWTDEELYATLSARSEVAERARRRRQATSGARTPPRRRLASRPYVRSLHVSEPVEGVVESTALVQVGVRCRALVLRLEGLDGRWRATVAELV